MYLRYRVFYTSVRVGYITSKLYAVLLLEWCFFSTACPLTGWSLLHQNIHWKRGSLDVQCIQRGVQIRPKHTASLLHSVLHCQIFIKEGYINYTLFVSLNAFWMVLLFKCRRHCVCLCVCVASSVALKHFLLWYYKLAHIAMLFGCPGRLTSTAISLPR